MSSQLIGGRLRVFCQIFPLEVLQSKPPVLYWMGFNSALLVFFPLSCLPCQSACFCPSLNKEINLALCILQPVFCPKGGMRRVVIYYVLKESHQDRLPRFITIPCGIHHFAAPFFIWACCGHGISHTRFFVFSYFKSLVLGRVGAVRVVFSPYLYRYLATWLCRCCNAACVVCGAAVRSSWASGFWSSSSWVPLAGSRGY